MLKNSGHFRDIFKRTMKILGKSFRGNVKKLKDFIKSRRKFMNILGKFLERSCEKSIAEIFTAL